MAEIVMPRLSDTMEEGTILRWLKRDGEELRRGDELVEIETDKATMTYESDQDGVLEILAAEGDTLAVGTLIARVGAGAPGGAPDGAAGQEERAEQSAVAAPETAVANTGSGAQAAPVAPPTDGRRVKASPLARRLAREQGVDLRGLSGSGPGGRILRADVLAPAESAAPSTATSAATPAAASAPATAASTPAEPEPEAGAGATTPGEEVMTAKGETTEVELTRTQQTIARRMAESKATIPHFTLEADVDMEECVALRVELKRLAQDGPLAGTRAAGEPAPTYNDMVVKACALALRANPRANSSYRDGRLQLHSRVNIGVAVATEADAPQGGALIVPTVFDADTKSLGEIARETRALAGRVRDGSITPPELGGGTFTVSNLGMFGVRSFTAIINPPQAAILSVGAVEEVPVVLDGAILPRHRMSVTLACDHRILYGADAAGLLARIRELLERPAALTL
jgi:pyruvate dehydrogenase E2 component (dihydrolipoamide acetyltransferase)